MSHATKPQIPEKNSEESPESWFSLCKARSIMDWSLANMHRMHRCMSSSSCGSSNCASLRLGQKHSARWLRWSSGSHLMSPRLPRFRFPLYQTQGIHPKEETSYEISPTCPSLQTPSFICCYLDVSCCFNFQNLHSAIPWSCSGTCEWTLWASSPATQAMWGQHRKST